MYTTLHEQFDTAYFVFTAALREAQTVGI